jgi:hypothetical protein
VNLLLLAALVAGAAAVGVAVMYAVRRTVRADVLLTNTGPATAIFGVVGTAFAVLLAFVMFVAFQSYADARRAAQQEAAAVEAIFHTSELVGAAQRDDLQGELVCYARAVVHQEWPALDDAEGSPVVDQWRLEMEDTVRGLDLRTEQERVGFGQLLRQRDVGAESRRLRLEEADPIVSLPVWFILGLGGFATAAFVLLFTDRREAFFVQGAMMGAAAAMVAASLLLVWFLDHPYEGQNGSLKPTEMERTILTIEEERPAFTPPCTAGGNPRPS